MIFVFVFCLFFPLFLFCFVYSFTCTASLREARSGSQSREGTWRQEIQRNSHEGVLLLTGLISITCFFIHQIITSPGVAPVGWPPTSIINHENDLTGLPPEQPDRIIFSIEVPSPKMSPAPVMLEKKRTLSSPAVKKTKCSFKGPGF